MKDLCKDSTINEINYHLLEPISINSWIYKSIDIVFDKYVVIDHSSVFFKNSFGSPKLSPYKIIMLVQNFDQPQFCNDTRGMVK